MPLPIKSLLVLPNPWAAIDHQGRPSGVVMCDPVEHVPTRDGEPRRFVGAHLDPVKTRMTREFARGDARSNEQDTVWVFATKPVDLPNTPYYRERIRHGELIAADEKTARVAGLKFADPGKVIEAARASAIAAWETEVGVPGAFAEMEKERAEAERKALEAAEAARKAAEPAQPAKRKGES